MNKLWILFRKEFTDAIRDKRSVMAGLYYAIGMPLLMCGLFFILVDHLSTTETLSIKIVNAKAAPDLIRFLDRQSISHADDNLAKDITLQISDDYANNMAKGVPAEVTIIADNSDEKLQPAISQLMQVLQAYSGEMASLRLIARGIDPKVTQPVKISLHNLATPDSKGGFILNLTIFSIIYSVFISGMNLAIDSSAGERERHSLTLLLSHPITTRQLILAKLAAVTSFAVIGLVLILLISKFAYPFVPWQELGFSINISLSFIVISLVICLPIALLAASLQLFVSFMGKTFKEAQSYITIVLFVPMLLVMMGNYDIAPEILQWLPISGQQHALMALVKGNAIASVLVHTLVSSIITLALTIGLVLGLERRLKSEKVIFGL